MEEKLYRDRDWLQEHYVEMQESTPVMAQVAGCSYMTIWTWLRKFDIPIRTRKESVLLLHVRGFQPYRNEDWLREHYIEMQESTYTMAREAGCTQKTILNWLSRFDIPARGLSEATFLATRNYLTISQELLNLLEGELLGDGSIGMHSSCSARYQHGSKYKEYVVWLSGRFSRLGVGQVGKICPRQNKKYHAWSYNYTSKSYPELVPIREKWYPSGKKIVPKDLELNSVMARHWYIGDGGLARPRQGRSYITLCTDDFDRDSIDYLIGELKKQGFKSTHQKASNRIAISAYSAKDFLDWIGPCPINCYSYKWDYQDNRKCAIVQTYGGV